LEASPKAAKRQGQNSEQAVHSLDSKKRAHQRSSQNTLQHRDLSLDELLSLEDSSLEPPAKSRSSSAHIDEKARTKDSSEMPPKTARRQDQTDRGPKSSLKDNSEMSLDELLSFEDPSLEPLANSHASSAQADQNVKRKGSSETPPKTAKIKGGISEQSVHSPDSKKGVHGRGARQDSTVASPKTPTKVAPKESQVKNPKPIQKTGRKQTAVKTNKVSEAKRETTSGLSQSGNENAYTNIRPSVQVSYDDEITLDEL